MRRSAAGTLDTRHAILAVDVLLLPFNDLFLLGPGAFAVNRRLLDGPRFNAAPVIFCTAIVARSKPGILYATGRAAIPIRGSSACGLLAFAFRWAAIPIRGSSWLWRRVGASAAGGSAVDFRAKLAGHAQVEGEKIPFGIIGVGILGMELADHTFALRAVLQTQLAANVALAYQ